MEKFLEQGGTDWRQSKFAYVESAIKACLYDIEEYEKAYKEVLEQICQLIVYIKDAENLFCKNYEVNLQEQENYSELVQEEDTLNTRKIKQRSEKWFALRKTAVVTGSTIYKAIGLDGLKNQREHFENVCCGIDKKRPSESVQKALDYGTENEINGIATLVGKILPVLQPNLHYHEEGCVQFQFCPTSKTMIVSPDGSVSEKDISVSAIEIVPY